jgi:hypothetical protein
VYGCCGGGGDGCGGCALLLCGKCVWLLLLLWILDSVISLIQFSCDVIGWTRSIRFCQSKRPLCIYPGLWLAVQLPWLQCNHSNGIGCIIFFPIFFSSYFCFFYFIFLSFFFCFFFFFFFITYYNNMSSYIVSITFEKKIHSF